MSRRILQVSFEHEDDLLAAVTAARLRGWTILDAFTPYPIHGLESALGWRPSRLPWVCLICGLLGAAGMLWFEHWTMAVDWPVNVGGKPWNSLPSDVPIAFEAAVLLAGFGSVIALFAVSRLYPGRRPLLTDPRATDDRFVLRIAESDAAFDVARAIQLLRSVGAVDAREVVDEEFVR
ncbi:MAG: DUF3341 domain-containing protein [Planctomycetaceae bacterium]